MQKKLIALAIASLASGGAFAAGSNVTIGGIIDQAISSGSYGNARGRVTSLDSNAYASERLYFKGSEDLGNGMKANFHLEMGLQSDNGTHDSVPAMNAAGTGPTAKSSYMFQRVSTIGLSGKNWGSVNFGRQLTPLFHGIASHLVFGTNGFGSAYGGISSSGQGTRANNSIRYDSNSMNGFKLAAMYSMGDAGGTNAFQENNVNANPDDQGRHSSVYLSYANGPLGLGAAWGRTNTGTNTAAAVVATKMSVITGSYDFKVAKLIAGWQTAKDDAAGGPTFDRRVWELGAHIPVFGKDKIRVTYVGIDNKLNVANNDGRLIAIGYVHPMSKRTTLYATWGQVSNDSAAAFALVGGQGAGAAGENQSGIQMGVSHNF